ncbi:hypothetical protein OU595_23240, partial [Escherichia coli]|nr:hypothetical protein [Escherichia coli]
MDESVIPQNCITSKDKNIFVPGKQMLALMVTLAAFPAIAEDVTGNYQSYFQDESDTNGTSVSLANQGNEKSSLSASSSPVAAGQKPELTTSSKPVTLSAPMENKKTAVEKRPKGDNPEDVSLLRLRQEDPPVHWNSIGRNMEVGSLQEISGFTHIMQRDTIHRPAEVGLKIRKCTPYISLYT